MFQVETLLGRDEFLELTKESGVVEVLRVSSDTIHVLLNRELWPEEITFVRRLAQDWWAFDRVVLAIRADLRGMGNTREAG